MKAAQKRNSLNINIMSGLSPLGLLLSLLGLLLLLL
jgi:hypothetical protein